MRLGLISDTHGHVDFTRPAVRMLESLDVDAVLHCGDIGTPEIVALFPKSWRMHFVLGNCDYDHARLAEAITARGFSFHREFGDLEFAGVRVALLHSHDRERFRATIDSGNYQLVCYGHTHVAAIDRHGAQRGSSTLVVNPGALYRASPHSVAVVELPACDATIVEL